MAEHEPDCPGLHLTVSQSRPCLMCEALRSRDTRVRADERERMTLPEWAQVVADARASAEAEVRERIAQKIEAQADDWSDWDAIAKTEGYMLAIRDLVKDAIHDAARIARGQS